MVCPRFLHWVNLSQSPPQQPRQTQLPKSTRSENKHLSCSSKAQTATNDRRHATAVRRDAYLACLFRTTGTRCRSCTTTGLFPGNSCVSNTVPRVRRTERVTLQCIHNRPQSYLFWIGLRKRDTPWVPRYPGGTGVTAHIDTQVIINSNNAASQL